MAPAFFTGEVKSCWTSLDLLQIILQLQQQSEAALSLHRLRIKTAMDVTVLMVALVQLKSIWIEPRFKMMAWVLLQKTMTLIKRRDQQLSLTSCMQLFFVTSPKETLECVLRAYCFSLESPATYSFFSLLYDACYTIPSFIISLLKIPPSHTSLRLLVHILFLEALNRNTESLKARLDDLYEVTGDELIFLLLTLVDEYVNNRLIVIDRPQLAAWTMRYIQLFVPSMSTSFRQQYVELSQRLQMQTSVRVPFATLFQNWFNLKTGADRQVFISELADMKTTPDGNIYIQSVIEEALKYLRSVNVLSRPETTSLVEFLVLLTKHKLVNQTNLNDMIMFICTAYSLPSVQTNYAASLLLKGLGPILQTIPRYLQAVISDPTVQKVPTVYQEFKMLLSQSVGVAETTEMSLTASPNFTPAETVTQSPITKERLSQSRSHLRELITQPIQPFHADPIEKAPEDRVKNRISVLINNVTVSNIDSKIEDFLSLVTPEFETWFADYLVRSRCERQTNYHTLYLDLVDRIVTVRGSHLMDEVLRLSIQVTRELLTCEQQLFLEQHSFLKNLGEWLGTLTIGRDVCLSQLHLNLTNELFIAFYHKRLLYVYEFVCFLLRAAKTSKVIRPPQPWLMALLSLLRELNEVPGIQNKIGYIYANYLSYMGFTPEDVTLMDSDLYLAIPEVKNNPDFSERASQEEVNMYFVHRYPSLMDSAEESSLRTVVDQKKQIRDFVPKSLQGASPSYSPAVVPTGMPSIVPSTITPTVRDDSHLTVALTEELRDALKPDLQAELHAMLEEDISHLISIYQKGLGKIHCTAVIASVRAMYTRDLLQVKDTHEVMDYLEKATHSLVGDLLFTVAPMMEREFLIHLHKREMVMHVMTDARLQALVKRNTAPMLDLLRNWMMTTILNKVEGMLNEDRARGTSALAEQTSFQILPEMTANEKVSDGVLNPLQRGVYTKMVDAPAISEALLSEEDLCDISVLFHYQQIANVVQTIRDNEMAISMLESRQPEEEAIVRDLLQKLSMYFSVIEGNHLLAEDISLVDYLVLLLSSPESISNFNIPGVVVRIAVLYQKFKLPQVRERLTAVTLEGLEHQQQLYLPVLTLLACNDLLDVPMLDKKLQISVQNFVAAPTDLNRAVFNCLIDLVLVRELVGVDQIPNTLKALEEKALTDAGKRGVRIEGAMYSCAVMVEKLHAKQTVLTHRAALKAACSSDTYKELTGMIEAAVRTCNTPDDVLTRENQFLEIVSKLDSAVQIFGENGVFVMLYGLLITCYQIYLPVTDPKETTFRRDYVCALLCALLAELVNREEPGEDRLLVFTAELEATEALLFQSHDLNTPPFSSLFYLRVFLGLIKEVILIQEVDENRHAMVLQLAILLRSLAPPAVPGFLVAWIELLSMPQLLRLLLVENVPELVTVTGDMVVRLLSFMRYLNNSKDLLTATQHLVERVNLLLRIFLVSFPGFLAQRASELIPLVKEDVRSYILNDCPPQCNPMMVPPEERDAFLERAWEIQVEKNPTYKQDLQRGVILEAAENVMLRKNLDTSLMTIRQLLDNAPIILRSLLQYWVLEEDTIRAKSGDIVMVPEEAIWELLKVVNFNRDYKVAIFRILAEFIRFPCKETKLFMKTYCGLYRSMDPDSKQFMREEMRHKLEGPNGQYGAHLTLQNLQRL